jgi:hypothetical protein
LDADRIPDGHGLPAAAAVRDHGRAGLRIGTYGYQVGVGRDQADAADNDMNRRAAARCDGARSVGSGRLAGHRRVGIRSALVISVGELHLARDGPSAVGSDDRLRQIRGEFIRRKLIEFGDGEPAAAAAEDEECEADDDHGEGGCPGQAHAERNRRSLCGRRIGRVCKSGRLVGYFLSRRCARRVDCCFRTRRRGRRCGLRIGGRRVGKRRCPRLAEPCQHTPRHAGKQSENDERLRNSLAGHGSGPELVQDKGKRYRHGS